MKEFIRGKAFEVKEKALQKHREKFQREHSLFCYARISVKKWQITRQALNDGNIDLSCLGIFYTNLHPLRA